jgi:18S rRNA (adenine1779-N6/adenine1780-N6)-dimethyltransferase
VAAVAHQRRRGKVSEEFRARVARVVESSGFEQARASKMSQDEFLGLLAHFNAAGIHFAYQRCSAIKK